MAVGVVGADEPFAVPSVAQECLFHGGDFRKCALCLVILAHQPAQIRIFSSVLDEHAADKNGFGHRAFGRAEGLEGLARMSREAVQIQTVIPVCPADQRKIVGAFVRDDVIE